MQPSDQLLKGIDVSRWQGKVDWSAAAASGLCEFAYVKATEGLYGVDKRFAENWAGTLSAGVPRGAYHFLTAFASADVQAHRFLQAYPGDGELPPALDLEWGSRGEAPSAASALEWLRVVYDALGVRPVVYLSPAFAAQHMAGSDGAEIARLHELWVAHYGVEEPIVPAGWSGWRIWQRGQALVPGIAGKVDVDVMKQRT